MYWAIDFDGTLCENRYPNVGEPRFDVIQKVKLLKQSGHKIALWTCREGNYLQDAVNFCKDHGLEFDVINEQFPEILDLYKDNVRKMSADYYVDDKAIHVNDFLNLTTSPGLIFIMIVVI